MSLARTSAAAVLAVLLAAACSQKSSGTSSGLVVTSAPPPAVDAAPPTVDMSQCAGCQLTPQLAWTFEGIYKDDKCTIPLVQTTVPACSAVGALGANNVTFVDAVGTHAANSTANVTLTEQVAPETPRFRKAGNVCVRANEAATAITPAACVGQRVCRNATGQLACAGCRTFANSCPDMEETRMYASIDDPNKPAGGGGGGNLARLKQCCDALGRQAAALGNSPEAGLIKGVAAQCAAMVTAAGPNGNAPELGALKTMMAGRNLPAICAGF